MSSEPERTATDDGRRDRPTGNADPAPETLELRRVQYPDGPTHCTMFPAGLTGMARLETWLSADRSAFVDLDAWR
jgi:hypothetical protein